MFHIVENRNNSFSSAGNSQAMAIDPHPTEDNAPDYPRSLGRPYHNLQDTVDWERITNSWNGKLHGRPFFFRKGGTTTPPYHLYDTDQNPACSQILYIVKTTCVQKTFLYS